MKKAEELLKEYESLMGSSDKQSESRMQEIRDALKAMDCPEVQRQLDEFLDNKLAEIEGEVNSLREAVGAEVYGLIPVSYIASKYFGKSSAWLYQRLNGNLIHGKRCELNAEQKKIFNDAIRDVTQKLGSVRLS